MRKEAIAPSGPVATAKPTAASPRVRSPLAENIFGSGASDDSVRTRLRNFLLHLQTCGSQKPVSITDLRGDSVRYTDLRELYFSYFADLKRASAEFGLYTELLLRPPQVLGTVMGVAAHTLKTSSASIFLLDDVEKTFSAEAFTQSIGGQDSTHREIAIFTSSVRAKAAASFLFFRGGEGREDYSPYVMDLLSLACLVRLMTSPSTRAHRWDGVKELLSFRADASDLVMLSLGLKLALECIDVSSIVSLGQPEFMARATSRRSQTLVVHELGHVLFNHACFTRGLDPHVFSEPTALAAEIAFGETPFTSFGEVVSHAKLGENGSESNNGAKLFVSNLASFLRRLSPNPHSWNDLMLGFDEATLRGMAINFLNSVSMKVFSVPFEEIAPAHLFVEAKKSVDDALCS